jgi:malate synthase
MQKEEIEKIKQLVGNENFINRKFDLAIELFTHLVISKKYEEFLTLSAYQLL